MVSRKSQVAYSPDGRCIAGGGGLDGSIRLWDAVSGAYVLQREGNANMVWAIAFSPDGSAIASGSSDNSVRLWDPHSGCHMLTREAVSGFFSYSPDGRIASCRTLDGPCIELFDAVSGTDRRPTLEGLHAKVKHVAFSPDGKILAAWSGDGKVIELWDAVTWSYRVTLKAEAPVRRMAFSPDSRTVAAVSIKDRAIPVWDVESGCPRPSLEGHIAGVLSCAFSGPDSSICKFASGSLDTTIRVWDVEEGSQELCLQGHTESVNCVAFSPDGRTIASGSQDTTIRLWDAGTGAHRLTLEGHTSWVTCLAFSRDDRSMASSSRNDRSIKVWQYMRGGQRSSWEAEDPPRSPATSTSTSASSEGSECWLLQRSIHCAEPPLWASGADFRGALGLEANAKAMLQQKGAKVDSVI